MSTAARRAGRLAAVLLAALAAAAPPGGVGEDAPDTLAAPSVADAAASSSTATPSSPRACVRAVPRAARSRSADARLTRRPRPRRQRAPQGPPAVAAALPAIAPAPPTAAPLALTVAAAFDADARRGHLRAADAARWRERVAAAPPPAPSSARLAP